MLRQRLILISLPVIALIILITILGLWFLQGMLTRIQHLNDQTWAARDTATQFDTAVHDSQKMLHQYLSRPEQIPDPGALAQIAQDKFTELRQSMVVRNTPTLSEPMRTIGARLPAYLQGVRAFPKISAEVRHSEASRLIDDAEAIEAATGDLRQIIRKQGRDEQSRIATTFRYGLLGLSIGFILILNVVILSFFVLSSTILRPIDSLVRRARSMDGQSDIPAQNVDTTDELAQLADILSHLAKQVQGTEESRLAVLGQVATTMSHELNNAINIIELQLELLRRNNDTPQMQEHVKQISQTLKRMTAAVEALRQARRIVLTDYVGGVKMLDLQRSAQTTDDAHLPA